MGKKIILVFAITIVFILLNIFSKFLYEQSWFSSTTFSTQLDPFDIITLVVTSLVTVWLGWYVSKKITEQRYQKEYVINDLKQIEEELNFIERSMQSSNIDLQSLLGLLNKLKTYIERFSKTIEIFGISCVDAKTLDTFYRELYIITTDLDSNQLLLDETNRNEINQVCSSFVIHTRSMIFEINKN